jgi:O-antigen/teichoic acid export membrane protein
VTEAPRIRRNAVYAVAAEGSRAVLAATLVFVVTRLLGPEQFGLFALSLSIAGLAMLFSDLGVSSATARFVAERRGDQGAVGAIVADALRLKLVLAGGVSLAMFLLAGPIADAYNEPGLEDPLRWTALALLAQSLFMLFIAVVVALGRVSLQLVLFTGESVAETGLVVTLVALGGGAASAAGGRAFGFVAGAVIGGILVARLLGRSTRPALRRRAPGVSLAGYAGAIFLVDTGWAIFANIDLLLIGAYLTSADVGLFDAIVRLTVFFAMVGTAAATAIGPRIAQHATEAPALGALMLGMRGTVVLGAAGGALLLVWADPIVHVALGSGFEGAIPAMRAAAVWVFMAPLAPLASACVNYLGGAARRLPIVLAALAIDVVINILLLEEIGIVASSIATGAAYLVYAPAHVWLLKRDLDLDLRPLYLSTVRGLLAACAMGGVLALVGTSDLGVAQVAAGAIAGPLAFVAVLVLTREITVAQLRSAAAALPAIRR